MTTRIFPCAVFKPWSMAPCCICNSNDREIALAAGTDEWTICFDAVVGAIKHSLNGTAAARANNQYVAVIGRYGDHSAGVRNEMNAVVRAAVSGTASPLDRYAAVAAVPRYATLVEVDTAAKPAGRAVGRLIVAATALANHHDVAAARSYRGHAAVITPTRWCHVNSKAIAEPRCASGPSNGNASGAAGNDFAVDLDAIVLSGQILVKIQVPLVRLDRLSHRAAASRSGLLLTMTPTSYRTVPAVPFIVTLPKPPARNVAREITP